MSEVVVHAYQEREGLQSDLSHSLRQGILRHYHCYGESRRSVHLIEQEIQSWIGSAGETYLIRKTAAQALIIAQKQNRHSSYRIIDKDDLKIALHFLPAKMIIPSHMHRGQISIVYGLRGRLHIEQQSPPGCNQRYIRRVKTKQACAGLTQFRNIHRLETQNEPAMFLSVRLPVHTRINLEKSVGSQESAQSIDVQDVRMQRLQEQRSVDAPDEIEKSLIMLLCSSTAAPALFYYLTSLCICTRKISASLHKTSKVTKSFSIPPCTPMACTSFLHPTDFSRIKARRYKFFKVLLSGAILMSGHIYADEARILANPENVTKYIEVSNVTDIVSMANKLRMGIGVNQNLYAAVRLYKNAALKGDAEAQYWLGSMYLMGEGVTDDSGEALYWVAESSNQKYPPAQKLLNHMLETPEVLDC